MAEEEMMEPAGPITVGLSGHTIGYIGFATNSRDLEGNPLRAQEVFHDYKFAISGSTTLDNGITVTAFSSLGGSSLSFDDQYVAMSGAFGTLRLGRTDSAAARSTIFAPGGGIFGMAVNYPYFSPVAKSVNTYSGLHENAQQVGYTSPSFNGLSVGLSYAPEGSAADFPGTGRRTDNDGNQVSEHMAVGINYSTSFMGNGSLKIGMGYEAGVNESGGDDPLAMKFGAEVTVDQISFGGGMYDQENTLDGKGVDTSGMQYDVGASWTDGPLSIGVQYGHNGNNTVHGETGMTALHVSYDLGPGIAIGGQLAAGSSDAMEDATQFLIGTAIFF